MVMENVFTFGKHKGKTLKWVLENHGSYVGWCLENIPNFHLEPQSLEDEFVRKYNAWKRKRENPNQSGHMYVVNADHISVESLPSLQNWLAEASEQTGGMFDEDDFGWNTEDKSQIRFPYYDFLI